MFWFKRNKIKLFINIEYDLWNSKVRYLYNYSSKIVNSCFKLVKRPIVSGMELNLILTNDKYIQKINNDYRGKNKPTNVISFETGDDFLLGDIFMSYDTLIREAKEQRVSFLDHYTHLLCHGVFHILGYDHLTDEQAEEMEALEIQVLKGFKIENPYE